MMTEDCECKEMRGYYCNTFEGDWECEIENGWLKIYLAFYVASSLAILLIAAWLQYNNAPGVYAIPLLVCTILGFGIVWDGTK